MPAMREIWSGGLFWQDRSPKLTAEPPPGGAFFLCGNPEKPRAREQVALDAAAAEMRAGASPGRVGDNAGPLRLTSDVKNKRNRSTQRYDVTAITSRLCAIDYASCGSERDHRCIPTEGSLLAAREHTMFDATHWRQRAEETRVYAEQMKDRDARARMLRVAERYELFAKRAAVHGAAGASRGKTRTPS